MKIHHLAPSLMLGAALLAPLASAELLVYEPFYYQPVNDEVDGRLAGKTGGLGWAEAWLDSPNTVGTNDYAFVFDSQGNLPALYDGLFGAGKPDWDGVVDNYRTVGGYVGLSPWSNQGINQARINSHRTLAKSAGEMAGENGVLWMSMVVHYPNPAFQTRPGLALTDGGFFNDRAQTLSTGNAIGIGAGEQWPGGQLNAVIWNNGDGTSNVRTVGPNISSASLDNIIVVKLEFGPDEDTVSTWAFTEEQTADPAIFNESTFNTNAVSVTADIDESTLNTLAFAMTRQENAIDEIRIGTTFEAVVTLPAPGPVDPAASRVSATPAFVPADGTTPATVTVTLTDSLGIPVADKEVTLADASGLAAIVPATAVVTDAKGSASFSVTSTTGGTSEFTATNETDSQPISQTASVSFPTTADATLSTVVSSSASMVADGVLTSTITVTLKDSNGFPIGNKDVSLSGSPDNAVIGPAEVLTTNSSGQVAFTISSTTIGTVVFTATETENSVVISQTASVDFFDPNLAYAFNVNFFTATPLAAGPFFPEIEADLLGPAGGLETRWNQFNTPSATNLFDPSGVLTRVSFTTNFTESRGDGPGATPMLRSNLTDFARGAARTFTVSGLPEGAIYDVWLASFRNQPGANERIYGRWTANNPTVSDAIQFIDNRDGQNGTTFVEGYNYIVFESVVVDENGEISLDGKGMMPADGADNEYRLGLGGFQLVPVAPALITSFGISGANGVIDQDAKTIVLEVPLNTDLATLAPEFTLSSGTANQTSGAPPSPNFSLSNPVTYTVTDDSTEPPTVNQYTVLVTLSVPVGSIVIDLGEGTQITGGTFGTFGAGNLPLPELPPNSILRSISIDATLVSTNNDNFASDLALLFDPTPANPGEDFSMVVTSGEIGFDAGLKLAWPGEANAGEGTPLVDSKTEEAWAELGDIDLATTGVFLGNAYRDTTFQPGDGGTWSGTITLTYDLIGGESAFASWSGGAAPEADTNGDGVQNAVAWALGAANPDEIATGRLPVIDNSSDPEFVIFTFNRSVVANNDPNTTISAEYGNDLIGWTTAAHDGTNVRVEVTGGIPTDTVVVKLRRDALAGETNKIFVRLKVVVTP